MTTIGMLTLDCADLPTMSRFWSAALQADVEHVYREYMIIRSAPALILRAAPDSTEASSTSKFHLDLVCQDRRDEVDRLVALGATQVATIEMSETSWTVMTDPEGNNFCVCSPNFIPHSSDPPGAGSIEADPTV